MSVEHLIRTICLCVANYLLDAVCILRFFLSMLK